jgi:hypothetical protein
MKRIILACVTTALVATGAFAPVAIARDPVERIELGGWNLISGNSSSALKVSIPERIKVRNPWLSDGGDVRVIGKGRFVGFALISDPLRDNSVSYVGGRLPASANRRSFFFHAAFLADGNQREVIEIEKGDYLFVLLTDGHPVTVELRLRGLHGHVRARTSMPTRFKQAAMKESLSVQDNYYAAHATAPIHNGGLAFQLTWFETEAHAATYRLACFWRGEPPFPDRHNHDCQMVPGLLEREEIMRSQWEIDPHPGIGDDLKLFYGHETISPFKNKKKKDRIKVGQSHALTTASVSGPIHDLALWISLPDQD